MFENDLNLDEQRRCEHVFTFIRMFHTKQLGNNMPALCSTEQEKLNIHVLDMVASHMLAGYCLAGLAGYPRDCRSQSQDPRGAPSVAAQQPTSKYN